jgi:serine-type D-Ala-D-Ala carboxypeptidase/endopeptidase (penicillin-binding protein 4)
MALVGPDYRFHTTVETMGAIDKYGRLNSDLVLVGRGDPNLSGRVLPYNSNADRRLPPIKVLEDLADQLVAKGLKFVDGDVVGDDSYYAFERYGDGWSQGDLEWSYGAPVSALTINDNTVTLDIMPADRPGEKAFVSLAPFADYYRVDNRIITTPLGTAPRKLGISREPGSNLLTLWGNIPIDDPGTEEMLAIEDPATFAAQLFRRLLEQRGVVVYGRTRTNHTELSRLATITVTSLAPALGGGPDAAPRPIPITQPFVLASYESQPLVQDLRVVNKISQNLHAELALRLLGREKGAQGTIEAGLEVLHGFLAQAGIQNDEYVFYDGSGLSQQNLVTPQAVVKLLQYVAKQPWYDAYRDMLPVAGIDGTLASRFKNSPAKGRVFGKTGSLRHVNSLSGFALTADGDTVVFSIMANNNMRARRTVEAIDAVIEQIVQGE